MKQETNNLNTWIFAWGLTAFLAVMLAFMKLNQKGPNGYFSLSDAQHYCLGMILYAVENKNHFPKNLKQTLPYLRQANLAPTDTNGFEVLFQGSLDDFTNSPLMASRIIVLRSAPWRDQDGKWARIYGFADGHCETHLESENNFTNWENLHSGALNPSN
ncbi:MAG TPA: hypothetical protein VNX46_03645 [Candidatus Acidoferrum sp.]|nr:hypothetical protein [Candidatus Acidoferrum sp.]